MTNKLALVDELLELSGGNYEPTEVSPELAKRILDVCGYKANRSIQTAHYKAIARDISTDNWHDNPNPIAFITDGTLANGHHRLHAIIDASRPAKMRLAFGFGREILDVTDGQLKPRSIRDVMTMKHKLEEKPGIMDGRVTDPLNLMVRLINSAQQLKPAIWQVEELYEAFRPELDAINTACGDIKGRGRTAAGIKASLTLRLYLSRSLPEKCELLLDQWQAFVRFHVADMDVTTQAFMQRLDNIGADKGSSTAMERAALGWIGWNPNARELSRISIRKIDNVLDEMRQVIRAAIAASKVLAEAAD